MKPWNSSSKRSKKASYRPSTIGGINRLSDEEKRAIYARVIPIKLLEKYRIPSNLLDNQGRDLFIINCPTRNTTAEISLYHQHGFPDPLLYGHITDTLNAQIHILFYVLNDPEAQRKVLRMIRGWLWLHRTLSRWRRRELSDLLERVVYENSSVIGNMTDG